MSGALTVHDVIVHRTFWLAAQLEWVKLLKS